MPRLLSKSETKFGNTFSEIKFIRRVLLELGVSEVDTEIDRAITLAKVDETQDKMNEKPVKGPMDKYVMKIKPEPK